MSNPTLLGRRIHLCGSVSKKVEVVPTNDVQSAREFISGLVPNLIKAGASFVVPVDRQDMSSDGLPICFDWLVLETISNNLHLRPQAAQRDGRPLIVAVQHYKNEAQIPVEFRDLWYRLQDIDGLMLIENAGHWNMNSKRMDIQAMHGDILVTLGGSEGVLYLANLYHDAGRPVIPLNLPITEPNEGSLKLWDLASSSNQTERFFHTRDGSSAHNLLNRLNFTPATPTSRRVEKMMEVLGSLRKPRVFAVRLLNKNVSGFTDVENYFTGVVQHVVEARGYELKVVDGSRNEEALINLEIFKNLHRSSMVIADVTGDRPNNYLELGYALGRGLPVLVTARAGTKLPFDNAPIPTEFWNPKDTLPIQRQKFESHWDANIGRRRIVEEEPLIP